jgi:hypothetical protein
VKNFTQESKSAITDSQANVSITNDKVVEYYCIPKYQLDDPVHVKVANGERAVATHFTVLGPVLGEALILSSAPQTLLSVLYLCSKGFTVVF